MNHKYFNPKFILKEGIHGQGVFSTVNFKKGETLFEMSGDIVTRPTRTSIQIGKNKHIEDDIGVHVNHSCQPNTKVDKKHCVFVSLRDIQMGEEITFNYNMNEDALAVPFTCECCGKNITGKQHAKAKIS